MYLLTYFPSYACGVVERMSRHLRCAILIFAVISCKSLLVFTEDKSLSQGPFKVAEVSEVYDNRVPVPGGWLKVKKSADEQLIGAGEDLFPARSETRKPGTSTKSNSASWRRKRSSVYPWLGRRVIHVADAGKMLDEELRQRLMVHRGSPFVKRDEPYHRRGTDDQEDMHGAAGDDWDTNGWAGNNLRIWG